MAICYITVSFLRQCESVLPLVTKNSNVPQLFFGFKELILNQTMPEIFFSLTLINKIIVKRYTMCAIARILQLR